MKNLTELGTLVMAISSIVGVAGAIATYFQQVRRASDLETGIIILIYIFIIIIILTWARWREK